MLRTWHHYQLRTFKTFLGAGVLSSLPPTPRKFDLDLNANIRSAQSFHQLERLSEENLYDFNDVNISTLLHKLASGDAFGGVLGGDHKKAEPLVKMLSERLLTLLRENKFWRNSVANTIWALGKLEVSDERIWIALFSLVEQNLIYYKPNKLAIIFFTLPSMPQNLLSFRVYRIIANQVEQCLERMNEKELIMVLKSSHTPWLRRVVKEISRRKWGEYDDHNIGTIFNVLGTQEFDPGPQFLSRLVEEVDRRLEVEPQNPDGKWLANSSWGLVRLLRGKQNIHSKPVNLLRKILSRILGNAGLVDFTRDGFQICSAFTSCSVFNPSEALDNCERLFEANKQAMAQKPPQNNEWTSMDNFNEIKNIYSILLQTLLIAGERERYREVLYQMATDASFGVRERRLILMHLNDNFGSNDLLPECGKPWFCYGRDHLEANYTSACLNVLANSRAKDYNVVLKFGHEFGEKQRFIKIASAQKAKVIAMVVSTHRPERVLEFGSYVGWSGHKFVQSMRNVGVRDPMVVSVEADCLNAVYSQVIANKTKAPIFVLGGWATDLIPLLKTKHLLPLGFGTAPDLIFLDHKGTSYKTNLMQLEDAGMVKPGTVILADNVLSPGAPQLMGYLWSNPNYKTHTFSVQEAFQDSRDWITASVCVGTDFKTHRASSRFAVDEFDWVAKQIDKISWRSQKSGRSVEQGLSTWAYHARKMEEFYQRQGINFPITII